MGVCPAGRWVALPVAIAAVAWVGPVSAATGAPSNPSGSVMFEGGPGTKAPPKRLQGITMLAFKRDRRHRGTNVMSVRGPTGRIRFSRPVFHERVRRITSTDPRRRAGYWMTWGHGYHGDAYWVNPSVVITLPVGTRAFYFYAEPEDPQSYSVTARTPDATSGAVKVRGFGGARFFGFVARGGADLSTVEITSTDRYVGRRHPGGFAIGEFAIRGSS
jgi:hypothetical protein